MPNLTRPRKFSFSNFPFIRSVTLPPAMADEEEHSGSEDEKEEDEEVEEAAGAAMLGWRPFFERDSLFLVDPARGDLKFRGRPLIIEETTNETPDDTGNITWDGAMVLAKSIEHCADLASTATTAAAIHEACAAAADPVGRMIADDSFPVDYVTGRHVLELGAGTGLSGLAAGLLGSASVVITDLKYTLPQIEANVKATAEAAAAAAAAAVAVEAGAGQGLPVLAPLSVCELDWADFERSALPFPPGVPGPDTVLACECVWRTDLVPPLVDALAVILAWGGSAAGGERGNTGSIGSGDDGSDEGKSSSTCSKKGDESGAGDTDDKGTSSDAPAISSSAAAAAATAAATATAATATTFALFPVALVCVSRQFPAAEALFLQSLPDRGLHSVELDQSLQHPDFRSKEYVTHVVRRQRRQRPSFV